MAVSGRIGSTDIPSQKGLPTPYRSPEDTCQIRFSAASLALADELGIRPHQAHCHRGLGAWYSQTGQMEHARAELFTAIEMYRDMEMAFWLPEVEAAPAEVEGTS